MQMSLGERSVQMSLGVPIDREIIEFQAVCRITLVNGGSRSEVVMVSGTSGPERELGGTATRRGTVSVSYSCISLRIVSRDVQRALEGGWSRAS